MEDEETPPATSYSSWQRTHDAEDSLYQEGPLTSEDWKNENSAFLKEEQILLNLWFIHFDCITKHHWEKLGNLDCRY